MPLQTTRGNTATSGKALLKVVSLLPHLRVEGNVLKDKHRAKSAWSVRAK